MKSEYGKMVFLDPACVVPNRHQPRQNFDSESQRELEDSIGKHGILHPIIVREIAGGQYELVIGERRWRAACRLGLAKIPAFVRKADDAVSLELALVENLQRKNLDPLEKAKGFKTLIDTFGWTQAQVACRVGKDRSTITNFLRLLELPEKIQEYVSQGILTMGHARTLLGIRDTLLQEALATQIIRQSLSVRETEKLVHQHKSEGGNVSPRDDIPANLKDTEKRLESKLGTRVTIKQSKGQRGKIIINFSSEDDLQRIMQFFGDGT